MNTNITCGLGTGSELITLERKARSQLTAHTGQDKINVTSFDFITIIKLTKLDTALGNNIIKFNNKIF